MINLIGRYGLDRWTLQARLNNITGKEYTELVTFLVRGRISRRRSAISASVCAMIFKAGEVYR